MLSKLLSALFLCAFPVTPVLASEPDRCYTTADPRCNGDNCGNTFYNPTVSENWMQTRQNADPQVMRQVAGVYYGDTTAHPPIDGGRVYGFDLEGLVRFGGRQTYGYAFAGAGYGRATFSRTSSLPGVVVRSSEWDWSMQGGIGVVIKKVVYVEAQYVEFQTNPKADFIPVVIGFQY